MRRTSANNGSHRFSLYICAIFFGLVCSIYFFFDRNLTIVTSKSIPTWSNSHERISRPSFVNEDHGFCGPCPKDKQISTVWQLKDLVDLIQPSTPFLLNIGAAAAFGGRFDPTFSLLWNTSFSALLVDPNSDPKLFDAYPKRENIRIRHDYIWPETIVEEIFRRNQISTNFGVLKLDIDSYECSVFQTIFDAGYRPDLIHTEFNPIFPPPIVFSPIYEAETKHDWRPALWAHNGVFYGCSLTALTKIMSKYSYVLLQVEFWDVVFIQEHLARDKSIQIPADEQIAYADGFLGHSCFPYCENNPKLHNNKIDEIVQNLSRKFDNLKAFLDAVAPKSIKTGRSHPYRLEL